jgi:hypothetical protein
VRGAGLSTAASVASKASARPELDRSGFFAAQIYIEAHFANRRRRRGKTSRPSTIRAVIC